MIKIENVDVYGFKAAIRGMRNPMNSLEKSDSGLCNDKLTECENYVDCKLMGGFCVGKDDLKLMQSLVKAGTDHSKFMRMINVTLDIVAPLYWWAEYDTYKVGTVRNSCSKMHTIHCQKITVDSFSLDHVKLCDAGRAYLAELEKLREKYIDTKDKKYWYALIQLLPSSYNQRATVQLNYAVLRNMYHSRKAHKLDEWCDFCKWIETLPYAKELICYE